MFNIKRIVPNLFTFLNLSMGTLGINLIANSDYSINYRISNSCIMVLLGCVFDYFDGFFARLFSVSNNNFGKLLDSLTDLVTFGVLPFSLMYMLLYNVNIELKNINLQFLKLIPLMPCFTAYRLARFASEENSNKHFSGMPSTAVGLCIGIFGLASQSTNASKLILFLIHSPMLMVFVLFGFSFLMVSNLRFLSLKMIPFISKSLLYFCGVMFLVLLSLFKLEGLLLFFLLYTIASFIYNCNFSKN